MKLEVGTYLARGCQFSYCLTSCFAIASIAFPLFPGSIPHIFVAVGLVLSASGGSTPIFAHNNSAAAVVLDLCVGLQLLVLLLLPC